VARPSTTAHSARTRPRSCATSCSRSRGDRWAARRRPRADPRQCASGGRERKAPTCWPPRRDGRRGPPPTTTPRAAPAQARLAEAERTRGGPGQRQGGRAGRRRRSGCCWRRSARPPSGCAASWRWSHEPELPPTSWRDAAAAVGSRAARGPRAGRRRPGRLDSCSACPKAHLVVDGYNVTKTGYAEMSLEQQRSR
jgi:hypothetical protein